MIFLIKITYIYLLLITKGRIFRNTAWVMWDRLKTKFAEKKDWEVFPNLLSKRFYFFMTRIALLVEVRIGIYEWVTSSQPSIARL
jgi:hypothetical protein